MAAAPPRTIGGYEVGEEIGRGGMGVVYHARQPGLQRDVVLKTLLRSCGDDPELVARFEREAQAAAGVQHQNVVAVHDCFAWRGRSYICQEYIDGTDLAAAMGSAPIDSRIAGLVALEIARGLEAIHVQGIVHRDLKPSNVLLGRTGEVKIADFGIALDGNARSLTQTGHAIGTPRYMSPEQLYGERADGRSDLFALGVVLYEMCTGFAPFDDIGEADAADAAEEPSESLVKRIEAQRHRSPRSRNHKVPRWLSHVVCRCLRAKPKQRWESASQLRAALERHLGAPTSLESRRELAHWLETHDLVEAREEATVAAAPSESRRPVRSWGLRWAATVAAVSSLAGAVWFAAREWPEALGDPLAVLEASLEVVARNSAGDRPSN